MKRITEGKAIIEIPEETKISKKLEVFYNPVMKLNRDLTVLLLDSVPNKSMNIADAMAGTGVRAIRIMKETKKAKKMFVNDMNSIEKIKKNFKINKLKAVFSAKDANEFLLSSSGFDYIDIDPFGSPNDFLDAGIKRISRNGILGITATDTSVLAGTYPKACLRNYWAFSFRNGFMHESALRILARKVQLVAAQYNKAMIPILSIAKEHYVRIFFKCIKGKKECDKIIKQHKYVYYNPKTTGYGFNPKDGSVAIGPMYTGSLNDKKLIKTMLKKAKDEAKKVLTLIYNEMDIVGSYDLHALCKKLKITVPKYEPIIKKAKATRTHYNKEAIKTKLNINQLKKII